MMHHLTVKSHAMAVSLAALGLIYSQACRQHELAIYSLQG